MDTARNPHERQDILERIAHLRKQGTRLQDAHYTIAAREYFWKARDLELLLERCAKEETQHGPSA